MKKIVALLSLFFVLTSCSNSTSVDENSVDTSSFNAVQKVLHKLTNNNFTVNLTSRLANNEGQAQNVTYKYNEDYVMVTGDADNYNFMSKNDTLFKFSFDANGEIVPSAPLISYTTGLRYESFYDYRIGFEDFSAQDASLVADENGYFTYHFGQNETNDTIILMTLLGFSANTHIYPTSFKMKAVGDSLVCDVVGLVYTETIKDTYSIIVNDIGSTENQKVEEFLADDTKGPLEPLDTRFSKLVFPYLTNYNYSITIDGSQASDEKLKQFVGKYEFDENVLAYISPLGGNYSGGYVEYLGYVHKFLFNGDDKIEISSTPTDSEGNFYSSIFGEIMFPFAAMDLSMFSGYKIDDDNYVITSDECIYYLAMTFNFQINDSTYVDKIQVHIDDYAKKEFTLSMNVRNKTTKTDLGLLQASYSGLNCTNVKGLSRLLNEGKAAKEEDKAEFESVMNEFKNGEYMFDVMTSNGLAHRYYTENYVFTEVVGNKANNYGYIKIDDHIYEFLIDYRISSAGKVTIDTTKDYALLGMKMPGTGEFWGQDDDCGYISHFKGYKESLYDYSNYSVAQSTNTTFWKFNVQGAATKFLEYFGGDADVTIPTSCGFNVSNGSDPYDKRVALRINYTVAENGYEGYQIMTFYNFGNAKYTTVENYLNSLKN